MFSVAAESKSTALFHLLNIAAVVANPTGIQSLREHLYGGVETEYVGCTVRVSGWLMFVNVIVLILLVAVDGKLTFHFSHTG